MFTEDFFRKLNMTAPEERWAEWELYRNGLMKFVSDSMWSNGTCLLIGAGNLHDIDISLLYDKTKEITLADIDTESVKNGLRDFAGDVRICRMDIGNLDSSELMEKISSAVDLKEFLDSHELKTEFDYINFDNVLLSATYTQLFIPQFLTLMGENRITNEDALETALAFTARLISHLNDTVVKLASDDATVAVWSDILEYDLSDPAVRDIINHIDDSQWMDAFYQAYIRDYGHGLGSFGIEDISQRLEDVKYKWLLWPYEGSRIMVVKAVAGTKR